MTYKATKHTKNINTSETKFSALLNHHIASSSATKVNWVCSLHPQKTSDTIFRLQEIMNSIKILSFFQIIKMDFQSCALCMSCNGPSVWVLTICVIIFIHEISAMFFPLYFFNSIFHITLGLPIVASLLKWLVYCHVPIL
jgi:hypothetical protein